MYSFAKNDILMSLSMDHRMDTYVKLLRWRHNDHAGVSNHQPHGCLLNRLFRRKSKKTSKLRVTGLCAGNSPGTGEFPAQMASYAENVSIWWRHHAQSKFHIQIIITPTIVSALMTSALPHAVLLQRHPSVHGMCQRWLKGGLRWHSRRSKCTKI